MQNIDYFNSILLDCHKTYHAKWLIKFFKKMVRLTHQNSKLECKLVNLRFDLYGFDNKATTKPMYCVLQVLPMD